MKGEEKRKTTIIALTEPLALWTVLNAMNLGER